MSCWVTCLGPEYGTTEAAWEGMLTESDRLSDHHSAMRDNLLNGVHVKAKQWQKETYSKQKLGGLKQFKELDDGFSKVHRLNSVYILSVHKFLMPQL